MKKGVVILGCLILGFAFCVPAVAQPSAKAVETILIDNFDTDQEWEWGVQSSRFCTEGYPILKKFEGIPNSLIPYHKESDPTAMVLGTKVKFDRKADNWFEVFPKKGDANYEIPFVGTVTQIDFWVWGANYNYNLEVPLLLCALYSAVHLYKPSMYPPRKTMPPSQNQETSPCRSFPHVNQSSSFSSLCRLTIDLSSLNGNVPVSQQIIHCNKSIASAH